MTQEKIARQRAATDTETKTPLLSHGGVRALVLLVRSLD